MTVVGIVGYRHAVPRSFGELPVTGAPTAYVEGIRAAGGRPVLLPGSMAAELLDVVDALVLTGGDDLGADRLRDAEELALIGAAARARVPLLAICRGMQLLAVAAGGDLVQDLGDRHLKHGVGHGVRTEAGSRVATLLGPAPWVTSLHHQAVERPGAWWRVTAWAEDGTAEAMEWVGEEPWDALAVQWHPEMADETGPSLFGWLVHEARTRSGDVVRL